MGAAGNAWPGIGVGPLVPRSERRYEARVSKPAPVSKSPSQAPRAPDPLAALSLKGLGLRVGLPLLGFWVIAILVGRTWALAGMGVVTAAAIALIVWALR